MTETNDNSQTDVPDVKQKPEHVPEKFWNTETGEVRVDELITSYKFLEKKLSEKKLNSVPSDSAEYDITVKDNVFEIDPELNKRLLAKGFTQEQAQEVYDLAVEHMVPLIATMSADYKADREAEKLIAHFGGIDKWNEIARQLNAYGTKKLPKEALLGLASSYEGILALHKMMMQDVGDGITVNGKTVTSGNILDINKMMNDPKYWRDKDPAYIAKVTEAFSKAYD